MPSQLSKAFLFRLRNHIPVADLIIYCLPLPSKKSKGYFRFLCPICKDFRTACNTKTNLARCFSCQRNFNPIDLVVLTRHCSFLEAVDYLTRLLAEYQPTSPE